MLYNDRPTNGRRTDDENIRSDDRRTNSGNRRQGDSRRADKGAPQRKSKRRS